MLEEINIRFRATLSTTQTAAPTMDEKDQTILDALPGEGVLTSEIARVIYRLPAPPRTASPSW